MDPSRMPNILLHGRVEGTWPRGRPKKRWLNVVREDCNIIGLTLPEAEHLATTRRLWSRAVYRLLERVDLSALPKHYQVLIVDISLMSSLMTSFNVNSSKSSHSHYDQTRSRLHQDIYLIKTAKIRNLTINNIIFLMFKLWTSCVTLCN